MLCCVSPLIGFCILVLGTHFQNIDGASLDNNYNIIANRNRRQTENSDDPQGCQVPNNIQHGEYSVIAPLGTYKPGDIVPKYGLLTLNCSETYKANPPDTSNQSLCVNDGEWSPTPKTCARACPSIKPKKGTTVKCILNGIFLSTCMDPIENTTAYISCESSLYEEQSVQQNPIRICKDGSWDYPITYCQPACGQTQPKGIGDPINGTNTKVSDYPWQIGVYNEKEENICGGSIINTGIVLSAAHCFTNFDGQILPKEKYFIAAGKYYRSYNDKRDINPQYSDVKSIHVPDRYKGLINFQADDIAIIILSTPFQLSFNVQPVCIDIQTQYDQPLYNTNGIVSGWGYVNQLQEPSEELKELSVPFIPYERCFDEIPPSFRKFLTYDKICAGYLDNATSVCQGDSGSALVFPKINGFTERFYVRGVVSTSPSTAEGTCDPNLYGLYTSVAKHSDFISDLMALYRVI